MDDKQMRKAIIRWLIYLVHDCNTCDAEIAAEVMGLRDSGELRSMAQSMISELAERDE